MLLITKISLPLSQLEISQSQCQMSVSQWQIYCYRVQHPLKDTSLHLSSKKWQKVPEAVAFSMEIVEVLLAVIAGALATKSVGTMSNH